MQGEAMGGARLGRQGSCQKAVMPKRTLISIVEDDQPFREFHEKSS